MRPDRASKPDMIQEGSRKRRNKIEKIECERSTKEGAKAQSKFIWDLGPDLQPWEQNKTGDLKMRNMAK